MSIDSVRVGGSLACVESAVLILEFVDGHMEVRILDFKPDGLMYEVFLVQVHALRRLL